MLISESAFFCFFFLLLKNYKSFLLQKLFSFFSSGWSGGAMVLGKLLVPGCPTLWMIVGQGPIVLAVGAGGGCLDIFSLPYLISSLSPSL